MTKLLNFLGLHLDQQSLANLWSKIFGLVGLVGGGLLNPAAVLHDGFGIVISEAANGRIKWWAVAIGVVVTYFTAQNTDHPRSQGPSMGSRSSQSLTGLLLVAGLGAGMLISSCGRSIQTTAAAHPQLSPTGVQVAQVLTVQKDIAAVQAKLEAYAAAHCAGNQTPSCPAAQQVKPLMLAAKTLGQSTSDAGALFSLYLQATDVVAKAKAQQDLATKITDISSATGTLAGQAFTEVLTEISTITRDVAALKTTFAKGQ